MKKRDLKELVLKEKKELLKILKDGRSDLEKIIIQQKAGKLKNVMLPMQKRKDIARILTIIKNSQINKV